jgi:transcriptional regulator ATRX
MSNNFKISFAVPGSAPVTSNLIFGIRSDILLRLLTLKARKDNPMFTNQEVQQYIPYLTQELYKQVQEGELTVS